MGIALQKILSAMGTMIAEICLTKSTANVVEDQQFSVGMANVLIQIRNVMVLMTAEIVLMRKIVLVRAPTSNVIVVNASSRISNAMEFQTVTMGRMRFTAEIVIQINGNVLITNAFQLVTSVISEMTVGTTRMRLIVGIAIRTSGFAEIKSAFQIHTNAMVIMTAGIIQTSVVALRQPHVQAINGDVIMESVLRLDINATGIMTVEMDRMKEVVVGGLDVQQINGNVRMEGV